MQSTSFKNRLRSYFAIILNSFHSKQLYEEVLLKWKGTGIYYLLFLVILCSIPYTFHLNRAFTRFIEKDLPVYIRDLPEIEIKDGVAAVSVKQPHNLKLDDSVFAIIDTTGKIRTLENNEAFLLLTRTNLLVKSQGDKVRTFNLNDLGDIKLNKMNIIKAANNLKTVLLLITYPFFLFFFFSYTLFKLLLYSLIGLSMTIFRKNTGITYQEVLRLSSVAMTPSVVIKTCFDFVDIYFASIWLFYFIVAIAYISLAVYTGISLKEVKDSEKRQ